MIHGTRPEPARTGQAGGFPAEAAGLVRLPRPFSGAGDDLLGSQRVGGGEVHRVTAVDDTEAVDVVQVQVAAGLQHVQLAADIHIGGLDGPVVGRRASAVDGGTAATR